MEKENLIKIEKLPESPDHDTFVSFFFDDCKVKSAMYDKIQELIERHNEDTHALYFHTTTLVKKMEEFYIALMEVRDGL